MSLFFLLFAGFIVVFVLAFVAITVTFAYQATTGIRTRARNRRLPVSTLSCRVVTKRTAVSGSSDFTQTHYFVTFESSDGNRMELGLPGAEYGLLVEGDSGELEFQGTEFRSFRRR